MAYRVRYNLITAMISTALQQKMGERLKAPSLGEYRGATTAGRFTDPQAEFDALRTGCGVYDLGFRGKISMTGSDRVRWLNGMVTNNIRDLAQGHGVYAFLLSPQGKIQGDMLAYNLGDSLMVDTDLSQVEKILATFDHYIIMDDVELKNLSGTITALGVSGPRSHEVLAATGLAVPTLQPLQLRQINWHGNECTVVRSDDLQGESYEIWLSPERVAALWDALLVAGATPLGSEALEMQRITAGVPLYGVDISERDLPQETEQVRALNFNKGCYVGQEIVERIRSRGNVHRKFTGFITQGKIAIAPGAKISDGEKEVGEITSAVSLKVAGNEQTVALGYIRREVALPGREVTIAGTKAKVIPLPLQSADVLQHERPLVHQ
jgi:folate-binding protein YgfZ